MSDDRQDPHPNRRRRDRAVLAGLSAAGLAARDGQPAATATAAQPIASVPAPDGAAPGEPRGDDDEGAERAALDVALSALVSAVGLDDDEGAERDDDDEEFEDDE